MRVKETQDGRKSWTKQVESVPIRTSVLMDRTQIKGKTYDFGTELATLFLADITNRDSSEKVTWVDEQCQRVPTVIRTACGRPEISRRV